MILYIAILGHLLSDYAIQSDLLIKKKKDSAIKGNAIHSFHVATLTTSLIIIAYFLNKSFNPNTIFDCIKIFGFIITMHFAIDFVKYRFFKENLRYDFLDQTLHLLTLFLFFKYIPITSIPTNPIIALVIYLLISAIFCIWVGDMLIRRILTKHDSQINCHEENINHTGSLIGKIERIIMFGFLLLGHQTGVITVFVIKSIARFKEYQKGNNDYYILGNLLSLLIVILSYALWLILSYQLLHSDGSIIDIFSISIG